MDFWLLVFSTYLLELAQLTEPYSSSVGPSLTSQFQSHSEAKADTGKSQILLLLGQSMMASAHHLAAEPRQDGGARCRQVHASLLHSQGRGGGDRVIQ